MASIVAMAVTLPSLGAPMETSVAASRSFRSSSMFPILSLQTVTVDFRFAGSLVLHRKVATHSGFFSVVHWLSLEGHNLMLPAGRQQVELAIDIILKPRSIGMFQQAVSDAASLTQPVVEESEAKEDDILPTPIVIIDQESDPDATVVELSFGDRLGALLDTMQALKELGLNVVKSRISVEGPITRKRFSITRVDTGRKIEDPEMLEAIRLTIISNMLEYHPESSALLAMGNAFGVKAPTQLDVDIATHIHITDEGPHRSLLYIETADRPGLLREIVKVITEINVAFVSGEFDTEGLVAKAKFHVNYRGAALSKSMKQVLTNCFQYFLRRPETNEDSY